MANLTEILGEVIPTVKSLIIDPPVEQFRAAMNEAGIKPPSNIVFDGLLHRFSYDNTRTDQSAWYIVFGNGIPAGRFGCWRKGIDVKWRADIGRDLTPEEIEANEIIVANATRIRDEENAKKREIAALQAKEVYESSQAITESDQHPYLLRKKIKPHRSRLTTDGKLVIPVFNVSGEICTVQYIDGDGKKKFHPSGSVRGGFFMTGDGDGSDIVYIAEGFSTAATVSEVTGAACFVSFGASNISNVIPSIQKLFPSKEIIIVGDNDESGVGQKAANECAEKFKLKTIIPPAVGDVNDYFCAGNDATALFPKKTTADWLVQIDEFSSQPAPISWLIKGWLQDKALIMIHGPSGGGKTFVVLDWCLRIASGIEKFSKSIVRHGSVVYLAGEGHHGLKSRVAAWKHHHGIKKADMWVSRDGCDLNTSAGYAKVVKSINGIGSKPRLIVVDTLHRFLFGDENSAQDAKTMLDACNRLMNEFECSVILIHHTGVSDESQHRARGSSAWRGALDIEISISPHANNSGPVQIIQRKSKDAELAESVSVEFKKVIVPGWFDEDGEPVTSAVIVEADYQPPVIKRDSKIETNRKLFESAWVDSGAEIRAESPYVSRSALRDKLIADGRKARTVENDLSASYPDKLIGSLITAEIIQPYEHGWVVVDPAHVTGMRLRMLK